MTASMQPYDRYDAFLHHIFRQTQGDAWFRPNEENLSGAVCLRVSDTPSSPAFRVFPYENASLEPFEAAVAKLNPVVAVKVRSAAVHAALAEIGAEEKSVYVDANTRIQVLETISLLPQAEKEQCAAFIRDEHVLVVWTDSVETIIPTCADFEARLIKLLWRSRPRSSVGHGGSTTTSTSNGQGTPIQTTDSEGLVPVSQQRRAAAVVDKDLPADVEKELGQGTLTRRTWYGKKLRVAGAEDDDLEQVRVAKPRPIKLYAPLYNGLAAGLSFLFIGQGIKVLLREIMLDSNWTRLALLVLVPLLFCVSLFFSLQIIQNISMAIGPIAHCYSNSKYYSATPPPPNKVVDNKLPHVTVQMPVFKESLEVVLTPSIESIKKAMQTYARQGGTSSIFINDDGLRLLTPEARDARIAFYATHNIGWVARPPHDTAAGGFRRAGRFKKASNMNYALDLSLRAERHLERLVAEVQAKKRGSAEGRMAPTVAAAAAVRAGAVPATGPAPGGGYGTAHRYGMQYRSDAAEREKFPEGEADVEEVTLEDRALELAMEEMWEESGRRWRPWAANGKSCRMGELVLLVDSDTVVPEDCFRDAAREMGESANVAIIQHESDVKQIAHHYFENGVSYFTRRINRCISLTCANGEVAPFVGHNAFLRWQALQDAAFVDSADGKRKVWSDGNVSEDFDMAMRLQERGYILRWATYSQGAFKEGVSLTVDDELNRWQKYAYGCNELLFNPLKIWWRRGPIAKQIRVFLWCRAPLHYKISMLAYMFSYYGIAASVTIAVINYVLLGFQFPVDGFFFRSWEIYLASLVVFFGSGTVGYTLLEYRLGKKELLGGLLENLVWIPFFFFFFGGLPIPLSQALLAHLLSVNIQWTATKKEVVRSNFFREVPKIAKRFWFPMLVSTALLAGIIVCSTSLVPLAWRVNGAAWGVIVPLGVTAGSHILFPIVLNPWLMIFSY